MYASTLTSVAAAAPAASSGAYDDASPSGAAIAWSEQSIPTICRATPGVTTAALRPGHVGAPFRWDGRVSELEWARLRGGRSARTKGKLYHALKF